MSPSDCEWQSNGAKTATNCPSNYCFCFVFFVFLACLRCLLATQTTILPFITNSMNRLWHATHVFNQQLGITTYQWGWNYMAAKVLFFWQHPSFVEFGKNTKKSLLNLSLLAAFTTLLLILIFTFTVMAFRDRWRNLLKKPLILILWLRRDFIECPR